MDTSSAPPSSLPYPPLPSVENSFFLKELRSTSRRWYAALAWPLLLQALAPLLPLLLMERAFARELDSPEARRGMALAVLGLAQALLSGAAGWSLGSRVFLDEHRQGTLESLRMIALSPWRWVPQKLLFPLYGLALVWISAVPSTALLAVRGHFLPQHLGTGLVLAGCVSLVTLAATLLIPPQGLRQRLDQRLTLGHLIADVAHVGLSYWVIVILAYLGWGWVASGADASVTGFAPVFRDAGFYTIRLRQDHGLALLMGAYLLAALGSAFSTANPASRLAHLLGRSARLVAFITAYYLFIGYSWPGATSVFRAMGLAGLPAAALALRLVLWWKRDRRSEDTWASREIRWL
ncbi:MAG TPA: hypothetical protein VK689_17300, partial [Armatimonadota bacterium]|nr:hypothetical protein [Armatimonadota bacterium]